MRVILVADNASTRFGGEAFIPFNYFRLLRSRNIDVRLVVHARNRSELVERFPEDLDRLHFVEDTEFHKTLFRLGQLLPQRLAEATTGLLIHLTTQFVQRRIVRDLVRKFDIDVVHQPIPVSPKAPSQMFGVEASVVMGPLNGGMKYPPAFQKEQGRLATVAMALGRAIAVFFNLIIPGKRFAQLILVANRRTRDALPWGIKGRVVELVENGVDLSIWQRKPIDTWSGSAIRLIFVGRLIDWKALEIVIESMRRASHQIAVSFEVIGDGPMRETWQDLVRKLGLGSAVRFSGFLSQRECAQRLQEADVLVLPSLFECGGAVVLEAMSVGLPVIATAWGGPLDYLDETCGILIEPASREAMVAGFSDAIIKLGSSAPLRARMGQAGYDRVRQHFDWERKIDQVLMLYASLART
ncbi:glycosyltransferase family 4 protein [Bradyrhizobium sp. dw_78]|uniref:glycosyltransferase family 4 protein n=1 Tax=Bradyrhizobium sp. dw_78 TaxID=2719793 RepID=UPI001BD23B9D|nr:glycosyltransferase family 4 protein [Bradyrhizobium sp. dw_78]